LRRTPIEAGRAIRRSWIWRLLSVWWIFLSAVLAPLNAPAAELELSVSEKAWLAAHPRIRLTPDPDFPPLEYFQDGQFSGIAADYVRLIERKLGIQFEIREVDSWSTSVAETKARENDVWSAVAVTPERQEFMVFTAPYIDSPAVIVVRDNITRSLTVQELAGLRVGVIKNYAIGALLRQSHPEIPFEDVPNATAGLKRVTFGSLDAVVLNLAIASHAIEANAITNLRVAGEAGSGLSWRFAVRNDWKPLRDLINRALKSISVDEHREIRRKWIALERAGFHIDRTFVVWGSVIFAGLLFVGVLIWNDSLRSVVNSRTAELSESENRIRTVVDNVIEGIMTVDRHGMIRDVNAASLELFKAETDDLIGSHIAELAVGSGQEGEVHPLVAFILSGEAHRSGQVAEFEGVDYSGVRFPMEVGAREVQNAREHFFVVILRDISERKHMEQLKSEFVSTVTHELRTPLTSIRGTLGLIMGGAVGELPEKAQEMVAIADRNTQRLAELVNDILDMEKIDSGRMEINLKPLDLSEMVESSVQDNQAYAAQFNVELRFRGLGSGATVNADETRLMQVMANLLSNAVKFSPPGGAVDITVEECEGRVKVAVIDRGAGIPEEFRARIFERFTQADSSNKRRTGGTGLGLSISAAIVEAHKGVLDFESEVDKGTTFFFDLQKL